MCLTSRQQRTKIKSGIGYMVRRRYGRRYVPLYHPEPEGKLGQTIHTDPPRSIYTDSGWSPGDRRQIYIPAFHIFRFKNDAVDYMKDRCLMSRSTRFLMKVQFEDVVCAGKQDGAPVIVAKTVKYLKVVAKRDGDIV